MLCGYELSLVFIWFPLVLDFGLYLAEMLAFWTDPVDQGFDDVVYSDTMTFVPNESSASVSASWSTDKATIIITNELWVLQEDGHALLHEHNLAVGQ